MEMDNSRIAIYHHIGNELEYICRITRNDLLGNEQDYKANAALICAAPDLLEACKEFVKKVECGEAKSTKSYNQMKKAILKAETI